MSADGLVRAVALDLAPLIAERQLDFDIHTAPVTLRAHEWALRELTRNLLHNAVKHSPVGGRLSVTLATEDREAVLSVVDDGPGIPAELRRRLFQPFSTQDGGGSGLGLAICREIVASLGGSISLDDRTQNGRPCGLQACVRLPLAAQEIR